MFDFGLRLRELRERQNLSQEQLGRRVDRSKSVISSYENNIKVPPLPILVEFALIFNVSLDYLVGIDKNEMLSVNGLTEDKKNCCGWRSSNLKSTHIPKAGCPYASRLF